MLRDVLLPSLISSDEEIFMNTLGTALEHHDGLPPSPIVDPLDDVFGSAPPSPTIAPSSNDPQQISGSANLPSQISAQHPSDVPRLRRTHVTNGYREGLAIGKEKSLQEGFDEGYSLGAELGLKAGWILGALEGLLRAVPPPQHPANEGSAESVDSGGQEQKAMLRGLVQQAEEELKIEVLCGPQWFGSEDGVWTYDVPEQEGEDVTFAEVAAAHPVLVKWAGRVREATSTMQFRLP